jgi:hypothetical protein
MAFERFVDLFLHFLFPLLALGPVIAMIWAVRLLMDFKRNQEAMIRLLASMEAELRAAGDARRWPNRPE